MRFDEFARQTGWSAAKASRYAAQGLIRPIRTNTGSGNFMDYTEKDVEVAGVIDAVGNRLDNVQVKQLVSEALYDHAQGRVIVVHPPHVEVLDNAEQAATLIQGSTHPEMFTVVTLPATGRASGLLEN